MKEKTCECGCGTIVIRRFVFGHDKRLPLLNRFLGKVTKGAGECWWWTGTISRGYGVLCMRETKNNVGAHRIAWELFRGPIPKGLFVCHKCDNKRCVNPDHLFLGTARDNTQDMIRKGRRGRPIPRVPLRGDKNGNSKLTSEQVTELRTEYAAGGVTQQALADKHGLAQATIWAIVNGKTWR